MLFTLSCFPLGYFIMSWMVSPSIVPMARVHVPHDWLTPASTSIGTEHMASPSLHQHIVIHLQHSLVSQEQM